MDIKPQCICQFLILTMKTASIPDTFPHIHIWIYIELFDARQGSCCPRHNAHGQMPVSYNLEERTAFEVIYIKIKFVPISTE